MIQQSTDGGNTWAYSTTSAPLNQNSTSATVTGLTPDSPYKFKLTISGGPHSGNSNVINYSGNHNLVAKVLTTQQLTTGGGNLILSGSNLATDPDGDPLTVTGATYETSGIVSLDWTGGSLAINPVADGTTSVTASVYDDHGLSVAVTFNVNVSTAFVNHVPTAHVLATQTMPSTGSNYVLTGAQLASDPDGDPLSVTAATSNPAGIVTLSITGGNLVINPVSAGTTSVTATVYDNHSAGVDVTFNMLVSPLNLTKTAKAGTTVTFAFTAPTGATDVKMQQSTDGGTTWLDSTTSAPLDQTSSNATVTGLAYNTAYAFKLVVTGGALAGESNIINLTTCSDISDFAKTAKAGTTADFSFTAPSGATTVNIKQSTDGGNTWANSTTSAPLGQNSTTATVTNLTTGVSYKFKLYVVGGTHAGESNTVGFTM